MAAENKAQQELEEIEREVALIEADAGQDEVTHRRLAALHERLHALREEMKGSQTAWQITELARHPQRPQTLDYIDRLFTDFSEIHGDRTFGDDPAVICGMARFHGEEILVIGTQKGRDMKQRVYRNFGTPHPEGYRKALRIMQITSVMVGILLIWCPLTIVLKNLWGHIPPAPLARYVSSLRSSSLMI